MTPPLSTSRIRRISWCDRRRSRDIVGHSDRPVLCALADKGMTLIAVDEWVARTVAKPAIAGTHDDDISAMMRCRVRWPIRLMTGLLLM
jgi:hypothetical protein